MAASSSSENSPRLHDHEDDIIPSFEELGLSFGSFTPREILNIMRPSSNEVVRMAKTEEGLVELLLRCEDPMKWQEILDGVLECLFEVMTDRYGHHLFHMILSRCNLPEFQRIIVALASNHQNLLFTASLLEHGSIAVQEFIKILKPTGVAHFFTSLLSKRFAELMISQHGRYVVLQCLYTFETEENEALFSCAIRHFKELATTEHGCSFLNDCLRCICGVQRMHLLQYIADQSNSLVNHHWGTIVVENVLMLNHYDATHKICDRLKMEYMKLARREDGSRVVQKCIRASKYGMMSVVESLLGSEEDELVQLASHPFGNYVIQTALLIAWTLEMKLYELLVAVLEPHNLALSSTRYGRLVNIQIKYLEMKAERL